MILVCIDNSNNKSGGRHCRIYFLFFSLLLLIAVVITETTPLFCSGLSYSFLFSFIMIPILYFFYILPRLYITYSLPWLASWCLCNKNLFSFFFFFVVNNSHSVILLQALSFKYVCIVTTRVPS